MYLLFKDRSHFLSIGSAEGKKEQMLDLEAEKEFGTHIWSFDSTHEYFDSWEYEPPTLIELREISDFRFGANFFPIFFYFTQELRGLY